MDLRHYQENKKKNDLDLRNYYKQFRDLCLKCQRPKKACFCRFIDAFETKTRFIILMHPKEAKKEKSGTGRLSHLCLKNSQIIVGESFDKSPQVKALLEDSNYFHMILYPGNDAFDISNTCKNLSNSKPLLLFVIDGTWACAKSMMRRSPILHGLPRLSFTPKGTSKFLIKQQPSTMCFSTIESLYFILEGLKQRNLENLNQEHQILPDLLARLVKFQMKCASDPTLPGYRKKSYKGPQERIISKKWATRKAYFQGT